MHEHFIILHAVSHANTQVLKLPIYCSCHILVFLLLDNFFQLVVSQVMPGNDSYKLEGKEKKKVGNERYELVR